MAPSSFSKTFAAFIGLLFLACTPIHSGRGGHSIGIINGKLGQSADVRSGGVAESTVFVFSKVAFDHFAAARVSMCSGVLIAPQIVLTAGHCVPDGVQSANIEVGLHLLNLQAKPRNPEFKGYTVKAFIKYPKFDENDPNALANDDLALLLLNAPAPTGTRVVKIPTTSELAAMKLSGVTALGYGRADEHHNTPLAANGAGRLRYVTFPATNDLFGQLPADAPNGDANMLVVKSHATSVCHGDSGGPLLAAMGGHTTNTLIGISEAVEPDFADPTLHKEWQRALDSDETEDFYARHPTAHVCSGGINVFVNVAMQLDWILKAQHDLLSGLGQNALPPSNAQ